MDDLFVWASKLIWAVISPDHLLLFLFTFAVIRSAFSRTDSPSKSQRAGRRLLWSSLLLIWIIAIYPVGHLLLSPLEQRFPANELPPESELSGVIVLGGAEKIRTSADWNTLETNEVAERLLVIPELLRRYSNSRFIYTSGSASVENPSKRGADLVKAYLERQGVAERFEFERQSRNTYENAVYTKQLIGDDGGKWLLVTSAFHMPRSVGVFSYQGIDVIPYAVDHWTLAQAPGFHFNLASNLGSLKMAMRAWIGLFAYWFTGKTAQLLPAPIETVQGQLNG
ncbi:MAG: YdcF family protein [Motiliproteus sp.]|nr:YdcF family protein [Motiliproteus sp.]MCW9053673.1 YdcF family protein [Motiliproteus sp.]